METKAPHKKSVKEFYCKHSTNQYHGRLPMKTRWFNTVFLEIFPKFYLPTFKRILNRNIRPSISYRTAMVLHYPIEDNGVVFTSQHSNNLG